MFLALVAWLLGARRGFVVPLVAFGVAFIGLGLLMERWRRTDAKRGRRQRAGG